LIVGFERAVFATAIIVHIIVVDSIDLNGVEPQLIQIDLIDIANQSHPIEGMRWWRIC
jgi:hypothetical protein